MVMGRPAGRRNDDYQTKRTAMARAVVPLLLDDRTGRPSLRDLAAAADVSVATLRHYFDSREGVLVAAYRELHAEGQRYLQQAITTAVGHAPREGLQDFLGNLARYWRPSPGGRPGLGRMHVVGLVEGLADPERLGRAYLDDVLEPALQSLEAVLATYVDRGELGPVDPRAGALSLLSPVVLGMLHQAELDGRATRPLDVTAFVEGHVDAFLRAWPPPAG